MSVLPEKGPVPGVQPRSVLPVKPGEGVKIKGGVGAPPGQSGQHGDIVLGQKFLHGVNKTVTVGFRQNHKGLHIPPGGVFQSGV